MHENNRSIVLYCVPKLTWLFPRGQLEKRKTGGV